jgi:hypothetical protein
LSNFIPRKKGERRKVKRKLKEKMEVIKRGHGSLSNTSKAIFCMLKIKTNRQLLTTYNK